MYYSALLALDEVEWDREREREPRVENDDNLLSLSQSQAVRSKSIPFTSAAS